MTIFHRAPVTVTVWPAIEVDDGYGGVRPGEGPPMTLQAFVQPLSRREAEEGYTDSANFKLICGPVSIDRWSRVEFDGMRCNVIEHPMRHRSSPRTEFTTAIVTRIG